MDWVKDYYTKQSQTFGEAAIHEAHRGYAEYLARQTGPDCRRVLELGCGNGGTAFLLAELGYSVVAIELNPSDVELARQIASGRARRPTILEGDFYAIELAETFDLVFYWDGFGVGSDADQRRLLDRIGSEWLAPGGRALIDVYCPGYWLEHAGETGVYTARDGAKWQRTLGFDALESRMFDRWICLDRPEEPPRSQSLRCYSPADFALLVEPTSLRLDRVCDPYDPHVRDLRDATTFVASLTRRS